MTASVTTGMNAARVTNPVTVAIAHFFESSSDRSIKSTRLIPSTRMISGASACQSIVGDTQSVA